MHLSLETINCEDNQITGISKKIADLENLKYLLLANNNLKDLSGLQENSQVVVYVA